MRARVISLVALLILGVVAAPAFARRLDRPGGKKPLGTIASFDGATLTLAKTDGSTWTGPVSCELQVKIEHRGNRDHGKGHGHASNGTAADLKPGAYVLRMKVRAATLEKIRLRSAPAPVPETDTTEEADTTEGTSSCSEEAPEDDPAITTPETEEQADGETDDGSPSKPKKGRGHNKDHTSTTDEQEDEDSSDE